jgi:hypothetical protein
MHNWTISALFGILLCLSAAPILAMTCDECNELDQKTASTEQEIKTQDAELQNAFRKRDLAKVNQVEKQIAALSKKLVELRTSKDANCKDACKPEVMKKTECGAILAEIAAMEADSGSAETNKAKIDEKYKALLNCHKELQQLSGDKQ